MARHLCPTRTGIFHLWQDTSPQADPKVVPDLLLCPDHAKEDPPSVKALLHAENYGSYRVQQQTRNQANTLSSGEASPFAKALWDDLHDLLTNERAWEIIDRSLKEAEDRGAAREQEKAQEKIKDLEGALKRADERVRDMLTRATLPPRADEKGV